MVRKLVLAKWGIKLVVVAVAAYLIYKWLFKSSGAGCGCCRPAAGETGKEVEAKPL